MPEYLSPGVYIEEIPARLKPIEGVSTSTAGFVGPAERGAVPGFELPFTPTDAFELTADDAPTLVTSFAEFLRRFGRPFTDRDDFGHLPDAARAFFGNGGRRLFVARIVHVTDPATLGSDATRTLWRVHQGVVLRLARPARSGEDRLELTSLRGISQGDTLELRRHPDGSHAVGNSGAITVTGYDTARGTVTLSADLGNDPADPAASVTLDPSRIYVINLTHGAPAQSGPRFSARSPGRWSDRLKVLFSPADRGAVPIAAPAGDVAVLQVQATGSFYRGAIVEVDHGTNSTRSYHEVIDIIPGNRLELAPTLGAAGVQASGFARVVEIDVTVTDESGAAPVVETFRGVTWNPRAEETLRRRHYATVINARSQLVYVQPPGVGVGSDPLTGLLAGAEDATLATQPVTVDGFPIGWEGSPGATGTATALTAVDGLLAAADAVAAGMESIDDVATAVEAVAAGATFPPVDPELANVQIAAAVADDAEEELEDALAATGVGGADVEAVLNAVDAAEALASLAATVGSAAAAAGLSAAVAAAAAVADDSVGGAAVAIVGAADAAVASLANPPLTAASAAMAALVQDIAAVVAAARAVEAAGAFTPGPLESTNVNTAGAAVGASAAAFTGAVGATAVAANAAVTDLQAAATAATTAATDSENAIDSAAAAAAIEDSVAAVVAALTAAGALAQAMVAAVAAGVSGAAAGTQGADGSPPDDSDYVGIDNGPGQRSGIEALKDIEDVRIIAAPGRTANQVHMALITQCEIMRYRFAVLDGERDPAGGSVNAILAHRNIYDTSFAAYYTPWIEAIPEDQRLHFPPSGYVAGIYARTDTERGVFKAPANEVVRGATGLRVYLTTGEQDILNPRGVNAIRRFEGRGIRVWGARTLSSDPEFRYVNVRRFLIFLEASLDRGTQWVVFEPNTPATWSRVTDSVSAFLHTQWRTGALFGRRPEDAFFVRCDETTMTADDVLNGRLICEIGVAIVRPAEFVIFRIEQLTGFARTT